MRPSCTTILLVISKFYCVKSAKIGNIIGCVDMATKYKSLLKNRPIRHMFSRIESNANAQIRRLEDMDIVNYYVLAKVDRINQVLLAAAQENYFGKKYSWTLISKV